RYIPDILISRRVKPSSAIYPWDSNVETPFHDHRTRTARAMVASLEIITPIYLEAHPSWLCSALLEGDLERVAPSMVAKLMGCELVQECLPRLTLESSDGDFER